MQIGGRWGPIRAVSLYVVEKYREIAEIFCFFLSGDMYPLDPISNGKVLICTCEVWDEIRVFLGFSCVSVRNIGFEWNSELKNDQFV